MLAERHSILMDVSHAPMLEVPLGAVQLERIVDLQKPDRPARDA